MEENTVSIIISIVALLIAIYTFYQSKSGKKETHTKNDFNAIPLQLQAYERLVMLCERLSLPNLISRTNQPDLPVKEMQVLLLEHIKQEFEYNASQQIYVSAPAWEAVRNLKDQNMLTINQVAASLPPNAKAGDLNKKLLEIIMNEKEKSLHTVVMDVINFEAKKVMK
ncbi:MAG: hypothetical protein ABR502_08375 [Chitinophagaceae bacterium]